jgi:hypothetical protein
MASDREDLYVHASAWCSDFQPATAVYCAVRVPFGDGITALCPRREHPAHTPVFYSLRGHNDPTEKM